MQSRALPPPTPSRRAQTGMSLIELMIAMVIGMAAVIIMMQMLLNTDTAKRQTVGGNDAQIAGTIALFNLERDVRSAGFGINSDKLLGCELTLKTKTGSVDVTIPLVPVTINRDDKVPKGDANTDTLLVVYGSASESSEGDPLIAASSDTLYQVTTPGSFRMNDEVVVQRATRPAVCELLTLGRVSTAPAADDPGLKVLHGTAGMPAGSIAFNLGHLNVKAYAIRNGNLTACDYIDHDCGNAAQVNNDAIWVPVASNIVSLRAQYGRDLNNRPNKMTGKISDYNQWAADKLGVAVQCAWARTVAVRIGLVARGTAYDRTLTDDTGRPLKQVAPPPPPTWSGANSMSSSEPLDFDLSRSLVGDDWRNYRYKAFETNVPLRNMIWQGDEDC
jgi:type IV pilus assembly protein PilW